MRLSAIGIVALVPLMLGTSPAIAHSGRDLVAPLCGGQFVVFHLGGRGKTPEIPCAIKACHAGCTRRFLDAAQ